MSKYMYLTIYEQLFLCTRYTLFVLSKVSSVSSCNRIITWKPTQLQGSPDLLQSIFPLGLISKPAPNDWEHFLFPSLDKEGIMVLRSIVLLQNFLIWVFILYNWSTLVGTRCHKVVIATKEFEWQAVFWIVSLKKLSAAGIIISTKIYFC